jgi:hypothetical protein
MCVHTDVLRASREKQHLSYCKPLRRELFRKQLTPHEDEDSLTISIFLEKISEDIDLTRAVSRQQLGIPGWLYPNATMDKGPSDTRDDVQTTRSATARTSQSREINGSLGCSTTNPVQMLENGRHDSPEDNNTNDKRDDLACATDVKHIKEYDEDGDRIPFFWPHKTAQTKGGKSNRKTTLIE